MWAIRGRIMPMSTRHADQTASGAFAGRVWFGDDGRVVAVTHGTRPGPEGSEDAAVVDVGSSLVLPGLIDLHNHLAYNTLPLWAEPTQTEAFKHHNSWTRAPSYSADTTWPAYAFVTASPAELLAYAETRALVGGTTSIQGSPPKNKPRDGWLVRNIDDETFGSGDANLVYASVLTLSGETLAGRAQKMKDGSLFIYHCAEGQPESIVAREYADARSAGCLGPNFVAVHTNAVDPHDYALWKQPGAIAWSPFSNLWLYGSTTDVPAARAAGITVCLGSDWAPSGSPNVLGELKAARLTADHLGWDLSDRDLVEMVTSGPGDVLKAGWDRQLGRLQPEAVADAVVIRAGRNANPYAAVVAATEDDVELVVIDGVARYGTVELMTAARPAGSPRLSVIKVGRRSMRLAIPRADDQQKAWSWSAVVDRLDEVRRHPRREVEAAEAAYQGWSGHLDEDGAPLRVTLDMPTGEGPIGGLPKDLDDLKVPPLVPLTATSAWLDTIPGRGFDGGVLDGLAAYYR